MRFFGVVLIAVLPVWAQVPDAGYSTLEARVRFGDTSVDFRAFRIAGARQSGARSGEMEMAEHGEFRALASSGDLNGALTVATRALDRNYANAFAHFDAMTACRSLGQKEEADRHERILNALLDSVQKSGDGKTPATAWFVVSSQEENLFLTRVLALQTTSRSLAKVGDRWYYRTVALDSASNQSQTFWFNAGLVTGGMGSGSGGPAASAAPPVPALVISKRVEPRYTFAASGVGLQGTVLVSMEVTPDGKVQNPRVRRGLGSGLDESALTAVQQWEYKAFAGSGPVMDTVEVRFRLDPPRPWGLVGASWRVESQGRPVAGIPAVVPAKPVLISYVSPEAGACQQGLSFVPVDVQVGEDGVPTQVRPGGPAGSPAGDGSGQAVALAVQSWRFQPATWGGKPTTASGTVLLECRRSEIPVVASEGDYKVGGGVTAPSVAFKVDPEYSEEARKAKYSGTVLLSVVVDQEGTAQSLVVLRKLGLGLDEEAEAAVKQWRFRPGTKDGHPVNVRAQIEVNFRLL